MYLFIFGMIDIWVVLKCVGLVDFGWGGDGMCGFGFIWSNVMFIDGFI